MMESIEIPPDYKYREVFLRGKPKHLDDWFSSRHPSMPPAKRAKIYSAFDALKGFADAISSKKVTYVEKTELSREDAADINRKLEVLHNLTFTGRMARANRVSVRVTFFAPCADPFNFAFGFQGQYQKVDGICWKVDPDITRTIRLGEKTIAFENIMKIEGLGDVFSKSWGEEDY